MIYRNSTAEPSEFLTDHVNEAATDPTEFKGLQLAPAIGVETLSGSYPKITIAKGDLMRAANRRRAPGTNFARWQSAIESGSFTLDQIGEEQSIPDEVSQQWRNYFNVERWGADEALNRLRRGHEVEVAGAMMNSTNFTAANGAALYDNLTTQDFPLDLFTAVDALNGRGVIPDTLVIPQSVFRLMRRSTILKEYLVGSLNPGVSVTMTTLQRAFTELGITNVVIPMGLVNQSDTEKSDVINQIWGNDFIWVGKIGTGELGGALRTAFWDVAGPLFQVSTYREEVKKSNIVRGETISNVIVINGRAGQLISTQI